MLVLAGKIHHLGHLGLGDFVGEHPALPDSMVMDVEHDLGRGFDILLEKLLQDVNDKLHRRVIVVQYQHTIEIRALGLGLDLGEYVKFLPSVRSGQVQLWREGFYLPLVAVSLAFSLFAYRRELRYPRWLRLLFLAVAIVAALNLLPPAWTPARCC